MGCVVCRFFPVGALLFQPDFNSLFQIAFRVNDGNNFNVFSFPVNNPVRFMNNFSDAFIVKLWNDPATKRKFFQLFNMM